MKNNFKLMALLLIILGASTTFSQVTVEIQSMTTISGATISNCGTIDFEDNSTVRVQFNVYLEKDYNQVVGDGNIYIYTKRTSTDYPNDHQIFSVPSVVWSPGLPGGRDSYTSPPFDITLTASNFNTSGGQFYAVFKSLSGSEYLPACYFDIIKDELPSFTLSPRYPNIDCDSTDPKTFNVSGQNIPSGSTLSYEWNLGSGWLHNGNPVSFVTTTTSTITLVPNAYPPSDVKVTPKIDGVAYPQKTAIVSLSDYTTNARLYGASSVCNASTFFVNGLIAGETITWASSNPNIATITPISTTQATVTKVGSGVVTITATVKNTCNQTKPLTKTVNIGVPSFLGAMSGDSNPLAGTQSWYSVPAATGATSYSWYFDVGGIIGANVSGWQIVIDQGTSAFIKAGTANAYIICEATNSCGDREKYMFAAVRDPNAPCDEEWFRFGSNPMKSGSSTNKVIIIDDPCDDPMPTIMQETKQTITIYNKFGVKVYLKTQIEKEFDVSELKQGFYIVKYETEKGKIISKKLIVQ